MFRTAFDWLDKKLGKSGERWKSILSIVPFSLYILQSIAIITVAQDNSEFRLIIVFLLNTPLAFVALYVYPFWHLAKKKYKIELNLFSYELFAPILVLGFYCVELACIIKAIVQ